MTITLQPADITWNVSLDRRPYRVARVADALREAIAAGALAPGAPLIEKQIAACFGTSRAPVREAIRELSHEGLVQLCPYRSAVVLGVSDDEVHEVLIPIRLTLERYGFPLALAQLDDAGLDRLEGILRAMEVAALDDSLTRVVDADIGFHEAVLELAKAPHTVQVWRSISPRIRVYFLRYDRGRDLSAVVAEHRLLYEALEARDPVRLIACLEAHIAVPRLD